MITRVPTQPTEEVTMVMTSSERTACASRTPDRPIRYSPTVKPSTVCLTTSAAVRLKRVMSGVITAPTMKPPATSVVPCSSDIGGPGGAALRSGPSCWPSSSRPMDQATSPKTSDQAHAGSPPIRVTSPSAETPDWTPNQPIRLIPMATPITALPPWPKPVQRVSTEVWSPSRAAMMPTPMDTSSSTSAPRVNAQNAPQNVMLNPMVEPSRNWLSADTWPNRCTATDHQEYRALSGTLARA